jgi:hypothetical protein
MPCYRFDFGKLASRFPEASPGVVERMRAFTLHIGSSYYLEKTRGHYLSLQTVMEWSMTALGKERRYSVIASPSADGRSNLLWSAVACYRAQASLRTPHKSPDSRGITRGISWASRP